MPKNYAKANRLGQAHLEIGYHRWQAIMSRYPVKYISQLPESELDKIIAEIEEFKQCPQNIMNGLETSPLETPTPVMLPFWQA